MHRLSNRVQPYAWGSTSAIADLLGVEPDGSPQAELWIGAHPSAPSTVDGTDRGLDELVAGDPAGVLGEDRAGDQLPYLLKVLSAAAPLSLQVHPDRERAARRFAQEEAAGVAPDARERLYRDTEHKPELLFALGPFAAMAGFRAPCAARELLAGLDLPDLPPGSAGLLGELLADLVLEEPAGEEESAALRAATRRALTAPAASVAPLVEALAAACVGLDDPSAACVVELAAHYPGDPGVLVSLLLNQVRLQAGQALYLPAGNVHAYLSGTGVELMASSDNVLRGGLTPKHVDVAELLEVVDFRVLPVPLLEPRRVSRDELLFAPDVDDFALTVLDVRRPSTWERAVPRALLCLEGSVTVTSGAGALRLERGQSAFATAAEHPLTLEGRGRIAAASPGLR